MLFRSDEMRAFPDGTKDILDSLFNAQQLGNGNIPNPIDYNPVTKEIRMMETEDEDDDLGIPKEADIETWMLF